MLDQGYNGNMIRVALITLYYGCLRQSELMPCTVSTWDPLVIHIKKVNMQKYGHGNIVMEVANDVNGNPVRAIAQMIAVTPTLSYDDPLFMIHDYRQPVPSSFILAQLHRTMSLVRLEALCDSTGQRTITKDKIKIYCEPLRNCHFRDNYGLSLVISD